MGLTAICSYAQSNATHISDSFIYVGNVRYNTNTDIFEYSAGGVLIKKAGIYAIESHFHILAEANDLISLMMVYVNGYDAVIEDSDYTGKRVVFLILCLCPPILFQRPGVGRAHKALKTLEILAF